MSSVCFADVDSSWRTLRGRGLEPARWWMELIKPFTWILPSLLALSRCGFCRVKIDTTSPSSPTYGGMTWWHVRRTLFVGAWISSNECRQTGWLQTLAFSEEYLFSVYYFELFPQKCDRWTGSFLRWAHRSTSGGLPAPLKAVSYRRAKSEKKVK